MKISTKGRYALRLLVDLARHDKKGVVALKDVAARQDVSKKYLEQIVVNLNKAGILLTMRGFQGGYRLAKKPEEITLFDVLNATEKDLTVVDCLKEEEICTRWVTCPTVVVWRNLNDMIANYLKSVTLQQILDESDAALLSLDFSDL